MDSIALDFKRGERDSTAAVTVLMFSILGHHGVGTYHGPVAVLRALFKVLLPWEFPGGPVVRTRCFHCPGPGSIPGQETEIPQATWRGQKKNRKNSSQSLRRDHSHFTDEKVEAELVTGSICSLLVSRATAGARGQLSGTDRRGTGFLCPGKDMIVSLCLRVGWT